MTSGPIKRYRVRRRSFWPDMHHDVKKHVGRCWRCVTTKACRDQTSETVAITLQYHWFVHYGLPTRIHSDQGRSFEGALIQNLRKCKLYATKKSRTTALHPNGNKTLCGLLRSVDPKERRRWPELIKHALHIHNSTPHMVTGVTPYLLMFGREPLFPIEHLLSNVEHDWDEKYTEKQARLVTSANGEVTSTLQAVAKREEERHKYYVPEAVIGFGGRVLPRRQAFTTRHKLQSMINYIIHSTWLCVRMWKTTCTKYALQLAVKPNE